MRLLKKQKTTTTTKTRSSKSRQQIILQRQQQEQQQRQEQKKKSVPRRSLLLLVVGICFVGAGSILNLSTGVQKNGITALIWDKPQNAASEQSLQQSTTPQTFVQNYSCTKWGIAVLSAISSSTSSSEKKNTTTITGDNSWCILFLDTSLSSSPPPPQQSAFWNELNDDNRLIHFSRDVQQEWERKFQLNKLESSSSSSSSSLFHHTKDNTKGSFSTTFHQFLGEASATTTKDHHHHHQQQQHSYWLAYLYAISHGAQYIINLDDVDKSDSVYQQLRILQKTKVLPSSSRTQQGEEKEEAMMDNVQFVLDDHDYFDPTLYYYYDYNSGENKGETGDSKNKNKGQRLLFSKNMTMDQIGIIKVLTHKTLGSGARKMTTTATTQQQQQQQYPLKLLVPSHGICCTVPTAANVPITTAVYTRQSFWAVGLSRMILPLTVSETQRDIWMAHVTRALFREMENVLRTVVITEVVVDDDDNDVTRGEEAASVSSISTTEDMIQWNETSRADNGDDIFSFLRKWSCPPLVVDGDNDDDTLPASTIAKIERLWNDLYEAGYVSQEDVRSVRQWLDMLALVSTSPVETTTTPPTANNIVPQIQQQQQRFPRVALMGQFNYAEDPIYIEFWNQHWRSIFDRIIVRGPIKAEHRDYLRNDTGIEVYWGRADKGVVGACMENLRYTVKQLLLLLPTTEWNDTAGITTISTASASLYDGVLYLHDDLMLNMSQLTPDLIANDAIIVSHQAASVDKGTYAYVDPRNVTDKQTISKQSFRIFKNRTIINQVGGVFDFTDKQERKAFFASLKRWTWWHRKQSVPRLVEIAAGSSIDPYRDPDGSLVIPAFVQADFLYIPMKYANEFIAVAKLFSQVFLELGVAVIVDILRQTFKAPVRRVNLCTSWNKATRFDGVKLWNICQTEQQKEANLGLPPYVAYHPIKMRSSFETWSDLFESIVLSNDSHERLTIAKETTIEEEEEAEEGNPNEGEEGTLDEDVSTDDEIEVSDAEVDKI